MQASDLANEYLCLDCVELVTFTPGGGSAINNVPALRQMLKPSDLANYSSAIALLPSDVAWHLWSSGLGSTVPAINDILTDTAGANWQIRTVARATLGTRYKAICRKV